MADHAKRVCLLTGAGGVLGTAFCQAYAHRYEIVAVHGRRVPPVASQHQSVVDPLDPEGLLQANLHPVFAVRADLCKQAEVERVVELALARYGRIDLLVNAAVHYLQEPLVESDRMLDSLTSQFELNALVPVRLGTLIAREFWRSRGPENAAFNRNIVNVSSTAGVYVVPDGGRSAYSASKAALNMFTWHMANEFRSFNVRVNATAPGSFPDPIPMQAVLDSMVQLDEGDINGRVVVLSEQGQLFI